MMRQHIGRRSETLQCGARTTTSPSTSRQRRWSWKRRADPIPILINGAVVESVESFKFLSLHITIMVQTHQDSREEGMTMPIPPQKTENIWHGSSDPQNVLQLHHREYPDWLHHHLVWQLLGLLPQGTLNSSTPSHKITQQIKWPTSITSTNLYPTHWLCTGTEPRYCYFYFCSLIISYFYYLFSSFNYFFLLQFILVNTFLTLIFLKTALFLRACK